MDTNTAKKGILEILGLGNADTGWFFIVVTLLLIILLIVIIVLIVKMNDMKRRYQKFMQGSKAISLEGEIQKLISDVDKLKKESRAYSNDIDLLFKKHEGALQKMGLVKYDAFKEMGGNMSFCLVLLDENDNGFVINSVHSSNGCYSYSKRIKNGTCDLDLSAEEQEAMRRAMGGE
ncbi:MAG: DUF4446 family protein [Lachnospiraceae bacterium]|nr:DUF4446 family protein [Lachnospiraceae bacterium]